jgi:CHAT domain-containing protein/tetratricopeptide (TPR) repeat protein
MEVDSPTGTEGEEILAIVSQSQGSYRIEVRSFEKNAPAGHYEVKITELRRARQRDKDQISADQAYAEAEVLREKGTAESLQNASRKYEEAIRFYYKVGSRRDEATALNNAGLVYHSLGDQQKALQYYARTLLLYRDIQDQNGEAAVLNNIGEVYYSIGERRKSLEYFSQAVTLYRQIENIHGQASALGNMGAAYYALGEPHKALECHQQALPLRRGDPVGEAVTLNNIGVVYEGLGETQKALDHYARATKFYHDAKNFRGEASLLKNIGGVYEGMGELLKALDYYEQALGLYCTAGDPLGEAKALTGIGFVYSSLGEQQKALDHYTLALPLRRNVGDREGEATTLNNIGGVYDELGEERKAIDYYFQALALYRTVRDSSGVALTLNNIGGAHADLRQHSKALDYFRQALPLYGEGNLDDRAMTLNNIGVSYTSLGAKQKALDYFAQTLPLYRKVGNRSREAKALTNIGAVYDALGDKRKALDYFVKALQLLRSVGDLSGEAKTLEKLMLLYNSWAQPRSAIFYGKQSVSTYQQLRSNIRGLDRDVQKTYLKSIEPVYRTLADLLIRQQRYGEAQQVLNASKNQQFFDFDKTPAPLQPVVRTQRENDYAIRYERVSNALGAAVQKIMDLKHAVGSRHLTEKETATLAHLDAEVEAVKDEFFTLVMDIEGYFSQPLTDHDRPSEISEAKQLQTVLRRLSDDTGQETVAIYTVVGEKQFHALIITGDSITSASSPVKSSDLNERARQLWGLLQSDAYDPTVLSQDLYNLMFKPIQDKLPVDTKTILWSLDGNLRYLPMGVLYDGKQYLVERYNHVNFTRVDSERMMRAPSRQWTGLGLGSSKGHTVELLGSRHRFAELPGVAAELRAVFRSEGRAGGVLEGEVLPDNKFTKGAMLAGLARRRPVVHIASHFSFRPGDETRSFLLLGDGSVLTLTEMKAQRDLFGGVELLTLSACNTAAQQADADGREIDAFAELAQRLGANAVMATLWPLADESAPWLMQEFYRNRQASAGMMKAEALRKAQLTLLQGNARISSSSKARKAGPTPAHMVIIPSLRHRGKIQTRADIVYVEAKNAPRYKRDPKKPFAHPYYWAPVILIGNLR